MFLFLSEILNNRTMLKIVFPSFFLALLVAVSGSSVAGSRISGSASNPMLCIATHCFFQASKCVLDSICMEILNCLNVCSEVRILTFLSFFLLYFITVLVLYDGFLSTFLSLSLSLFFSLSEETLLLYVRSGKIHPKI